MPQLHHMLYMLLIVSLGIAWSKPAHAQQAVEFFPGPLVSSNRIISMGGAYTGIASGADAHLINPASFAQRNRPRRSSWFTGDWTLSWFDDAPNVDADDDQLPRNSFHLDAGFHLNFGRFGIGAHGYNQSFGVSEFNAAQGTDLDVSLGYGGLGLGWSFWKDQFTMGVLVSSASLTITEVRGIEESGEFDELRVFRSQGQGVMLGMHLKLEGAPWQVGLRARREVRGFALLDDGDEEDAGMHTQIVIPKQLSLGLATHLAISKRFARPMLIATDFVLTGRTRNATTLQGFVLDNGEVTGDQVTLAPHIGAQLEVFPERLRLRAGSYWEPDRALGKVGRAHVTFGGEVRVKVIWDWRIDACVDIAPGYFNWGLGLGFWTPSPADIAPSISATGSDKRSS